MALQPGPEVEQLAEQFTVAESYAIVILIFCGDPKVARQCHTCVPAAVLVWAVSRLLYGPRMQPGPPVRPIFTLLEGGH